MIGSELLLPHGDIFPDIPCLLPPMVESTREFILAPDKVRLSVIDVDDFVLSITQAKGNLIMNELIGSLGYSATVCMAGGIRSPLAGRFLKLNDMPDAGGRALFGSAMSVMAQDISQGTIVDGKIKPLRYKEPIDTLFLFLDVGEKDYAKKNRNAIKLDVPVINQLKFEVFTLPALFAGIRSLQDRYPSKPNVSLSIIIVNGNVSLLRQAFEDNITSIEGLYDKTEVQTFLEMLKSSNS